MGRLDRLVVKNFKSYKGVHTIGNFRDFTCVIGPNGSGKSNIVDAISFVLGVVDSASLRGENLKSLLYTKEGSDATATSAYVELVYTEQDDEQESEEHEETTFRREIVRGGSASNYYISEARVSRDDYHRRLEQLNVLVKVKNFLVFQGDIEAIATSKAKERTSLFEKISGSDQFEKDYSELKRLKDEAEERVQFRREIQKSINAEKKQFQAQKKEADEYMELLEEQRREKLEHVLFQLYHVETELKVVAKQSRKTDNELEIAQQNQASRSSELTDKKSSQAKQHKQIVRKTRQIKELQQQISSFNPDLISLREQIEHSEKKAEKRQRRLDKLRQEAANHTKEVEQLERSLREVSDAMEEFEREQAEESQAMGTTLEGDQLEEYNEKKLEAARSTAKERAELEQLTRTHELELQSQATLTTKISELQERRAVLDNRRDNLLGRLEATNKAMQDARLQHQELAVAKEEARLEFEQLLAKKEDLQARIETVQNELREAKADQKESKREAQFAETLTRLAQVFPGVRGRISDLCKCSQKRYELAVTVALGRHMDDIVTDDEATAIECLNYMREQRLGTATFIPLDTVQATPINEKLRSLGDSIRLVFDLLEYDKSLKKAVLFICGNTLVCDTLEQANQLAFGGASTSGERYKVVSLDGTIISKSGFMTGGNGGNLESRVRQWERKNIEKLKKQRAKLIQDLATVNRNTRAADKEQQIQAQLEGIDSRVHYLKTDLKLTEERMKEVEKELKIVDNELARSVPTLEQLKKQIDTRAKKIAKLNTKIHQREDELFATFCEAVGVANIREFEEKRLQDAKRATERRLHFSSLKSKLQHQLEYERSRNFTTNVQRKEAALQQAKAALAEASKQEAKLKAKQKKAQDALEAEKKEREQYTRVIDELESDIQAYKRALEEVTRTVSELQKRSAMELSQIEQLKARRHAIFHECRLEGIQIPVTRGSISDILEQADAIDPNEDENDDAMEVADGDGDVASSQALKRIYEQEDNLKIDYRTLPGDKRSLDPAERKAAHREYLDSIHKRQAKIDKIDPNLKAGEHFKDIEERFKNTKAEFNSAREENKNAEARFTEIATKRRDTFRHAFSRISDSIGKIYMELTSSTGTAQDGGTAYLSLENQEDPFLGGINFTAMPPGKSFHNVEQLSGGERTVAALALLFAIQSFRPSPFFILDEIDAALDKYNISRVVQFLQKQKKNVQFLVVSHNNHFYENADSLVGVMLDGDQSCSRTLTLDLSQFGQ